MYPLRLLFLALLMLGICAPAPGGPATKAANFNDGFDRLVALGLPPLDHATWTSVASNAPGHPSNNYELRQAFGRMKGTGWKINPPNGDPLALALGSVATIPWDGKAAAVGNRSRTLLGRLFGAKAKAPKNIDLAADVDAMIKALVKLSKTENFRSSLEYMDISSFGTLLIFAAQLHQTGHDELAKRLASTLFEILPDRERLIDAAVSQIANHAYKETSAEFFESGDWQRYHDEVTALLERFPRGWNKRLAVAMLLDPLEKRAKNEPIPVPAIEGTTLDPKALAALARLVEERPSQPGEDAPVELPGGLKLEDIPASQRAEILEYYAANMRNMANRLNVAPLWLLGEKKSERPSALSTRKDTPVEELLALGIEALPALAAVADDPTLTYLQNGGGGRSSFFSSRESLMERAARAYQSLDRPLSRGEIASRLLAATLPGNEYGGGQTDPESLRETALEFYREHHSKNRTQLALVFLNDGDESRRDLAAKILAESKDPTAWAAFERHVLEGPPPAESFSVVQLYLRARKAAAAPFFEKYAAIMREEYGDIDLKDDSSGYDSGTWIIRQSGGVEKLLKSLAVFIDKAAPVDIARKIATSNDDDESFQTAVASLQSLLTDLPSEKALSTCLEGAVAAKNPDRRAAFIALVFRASGREGPGKTPPSMSNAHRPLWKKLIADERPFDSNKLNWGMMQTIRDFAALALESTFDPMATRNFVTTAEVFGGWNTSLYLARASARLDDKSPPPLPDASKVPENRFAEILDAAAKLKGAAIFDYVTSLNPDEIAAWIKHEGEPDFLKAARPYITHHFDPKAWHSTDMVPNSPEILAAGPFKVGTKLSEKSLRDICSDLLLHADDHSPGIYFLNNNYLGIGIDAMIARPKPQTAKDESRGYSTTGIITDECAEAAMQLIDTQGADAILVANIQSRFGSPSSTRLLKNGKVVAKTQKDDPSSEESEDQDEDAFKQFDTLLQAPESSRFSLRIVILTRKDAETFNKASKEINPQ